MTDLDPAPDPAPARRRYGGLSAAERDAQRRQRLIDAGLELFGTVGYGSTSIESICLTAGVSTRNFYDHFANGEALLIAVYDRISQEALEAIARVLPASGTLEGQVRAALEAFAEVMLRDERKARVNFIEVIGASPAVEAHRRRVIRQFAEVVGVVAREHLGEGTVPARSVDTAALALIGAVQEVLRDWVTGSDRPPLAGILEDLVTIFKAVAEAR